MPVKSARGRWRRGIEWRDARIGARRFPGGSWSLTHQGLAAWTAWPWRLWRRVLAVGVMVLAGLIGGCRAAGGPLPQATLRPVKQTSHVTARTSTEKTAPRAVPTEWPLVGRLLVMSISALGAGNDIRTVDVANGRVIELWSLGEITTVSEWLPRSDGQWVVYRLSSASHSAWDQLAVRAIEPVAEPTTIAYSPKMWQAHLAGVAWSGDGTEVAFGWQEGPPAHGTHGLGREARWELRSARLELPSLAAGRPAAEDEAIVLWRSTEDPRRVPLSLAAWHRAARRAVVLELAPQGGPAESLRWLELDHGRVARRWPIRALPSELRASPDGTWLAAPDLTIPELKLVNVAFGSMSAIRPLVGGAQVVSLVWSVDGRWLAWAEVPQRLKLGVPTLDRAASRRPEDGDELTLIRAMAVDPLAGPRPGVPELVVRVPGSDSRPLAFSPDGSALLVGERRGAELEPTRLILYGLGDGAARRLNWTLPKGTWRVNWLP